MTTKVRNWLCDNSRSFEAIDGDAKADASSKISFDPHNVCSTQCVKRESFVRKPLSKHEDYF